jgi:hypothetical protein
MKTLNTAQFGAGYTTFFNTFIRTIGSSFSLVLEFSCKAQKQHLKGSTFGKESLLVGKNQYD